MERVVTYTISVHYEDGTYWAEIVEMPGCFAAGDTVEELTEALTEALGLVLSTPTSPVTAALGSMHVIGGVEQVQAEAHVISA